MCGILIRCVVILVIRGRSAAKNVVLGWILWVSQLLLSVLVQIDNEWCIPQMAWFTL
jgi:hypothetical protein